MLRQRRQGQAHDLSPGHGCAGTRKHPLCNRSQAAHVACLSGSSTARRAVRTHAPASQSSNAMMHRHVPWSVGGAAGSAPGAPTTAQLLGPACRAPAPSCRALTRSTPAPAFNSGPRVHAAGAGCSAVRHHASSSRQVLDDSTTPLGTLVDDPAGLPQCRVPHMSVPM